MVEAKLLRKKLKNGLIVDKWDLVTIIEKQQAEVEALKQIIGQFVKPDLKIEEVMSENCTCYKLGYNPLNDYRKVKAK